jgi:mannose-1-phosphate guanylyltransferase/mannose-6-phosphate isomerase
MKPSNRVFIRIGGLEVKSVILSGGSGTRLFPLSSKKYPKQFLPFVDNESLFQRTVLRNLKYVNSMENIVIVSNINYIFLIKDQLQLIIKDIYTENLILEPVAKNTAPAVALATKYALDKLKVSKDEILFISPSDHMVSPDDKFVNYLSKSEELAKQGYIVTFGINPTKPETGYGYIEADDSRKLNEAYRVKKFHKKPDLQTAEDYLKKGTCYWNSGMFAFSIKTILEEFKRHSPEIYSLIENRTFDEVIKNFKEMHNISIDYAVMEKTNKAVVLPLDIMWSDVGSWNSVYDIMSRDKDGNVKVGNIVDLDTKNSLIIGNKRLIATIGVKDLVIVDTPDAVVITKRGNDQKIKDLVNLLKKNPKTKEITELGATVHRPWGSYTNLEYGKGYRIKRITVKPGESLSLQMHHHRNEHWIVVKGTAKVILGDRNGTLKEFYVHENESIYVSKTTKHRLVNPGKISLEVIEVQTGEYLEEDDIIRFQDKYRREKNEAF